MSGFVSEISLLSNYPKRQRWFVSFARGASPSMRERRINWLLRCLIYGLSCKSSREGRLVSLYKSRKKAAPVMHPGRIRPINVLIAKSSPTKLLPQNAQPYTRNRCSFRQRRFTSPWYRTKPFVKLEISLAPVKFSALAHSLPKSVRRRLTNEKTSCHPCFSDYS
jgi:hypothetical protein